MATPFVDPRTGQLYFRSAVPEALRAAFGGQAQAKKTLGTKDPAVAKAAFARENGSPKPDGSWLKGRSRRPPRRSSCGGAKVPRG